MESYIFLEQTVPEKGWAILLTPNVMKGLIGKCESLGTFN